MLDGEGEATKLDQIMGGARARLGSVVWRLEREALGVQWRGGQLSDAEYLAQVAALDRSVISRMRRREFRRFLASHRELAGRRTRDGGFSFLCALPFREQPYLDAVRRAVVTAGGPATTEQVAAAMFGPDFDTADLPELERRLTQLTASRRARLRAAARPSTWDLALPADRR